MKNTSVEAKARKRQAEAQLAAQRRQYLSDVDLARRFGVSRVTIWRWSAQGILPKPVRLAANCTRWRSGEVDAAEEVWLAAREAEAERDVAEA